MPDRAVPSQPAQWDVLAHRLSELRTAAGEPSFTEIARLVTEARMAAGLSDAAARVARSTVYDTFRTGRSRINLALVREIALALGATDPDVDTWMAEARTPPAEPPTPPAELVEAPADRMPGERSEPGVSRSLHAHAPSPTPTAELVEAPAPTHVYALLVACVLLNLAGNAFITFFGFPIYLDMVGTAIAAIALGPWRGAAVGLATNVAAVVTVGWTSLPFALVNVAGALVWGYGVRRFGMGRSLARYFSLNVVTAIVCSVFAVPIIVAIFGADAQTEDNLITELVHDALGGIVVSVGLSNLLTSVADKLMSGFVALVVISALPLALRRGSGLTLLSVDDARP